MNVLTVLTGDSGDRVLLNGRLYSLENLSLRKSWEFSENNGTVTSLLLVKLDREKYASFLSDL